jgi:hypothetical protein
MNSAGNVGRWRFVLLATKIKKNRKRQKSNWKEYKIILPSIASLGQLS